MNTVPTSAKDDIRVYFAAERTLLSWIRTGVAMMGFGFVVARVGIYLQDSSAQQAMLQPQHAALSIWVGTALLMLGVVVTAAAAASYIRTLRRLKRGEPLIFSALSLATVTAVMLAALGLVMAGYVVVVGIA